MELIIIEKKPDGTEEKKTVAPISKVKIPVGDYESVYLKRIAELKAKDGKK